MEGNNVIAVFKKEYSCYYINMHIRLFDYMLL